MSLITNGQDAGEVRTIINNAIENILISKFSTNLITIEDGVSQKKLVFPATTPCTISIRGKWYKLPQSTELEFTALYKTICVDLDSLPATNGNEVTLVEVAAYGSVIDKDSYLPIATHWNTGTNIVIHDGFKEFVNFGLKALISTNATGISTNAAGITNLKKKPEIARYKTSEITIRDGISKKKVIFPSTSPAVITYGGHFYYLPTSTEVEFSANYRTLAIDLSLLSGTNNDPVTLTQINAYATDLDWTRYVPIVTLWNLGLTHVWPDFVQFFEAEVATRGLSMAVLGDSIMMMMSSSYPSAPASAGDHDDQDWPAMKAALQLDELINCGIGGSTWQDRGDVYITDTPLMATETAMISNGLRMLDRLITAGRTSPDIILIAAGTNNPDNDGDYATVMAMSFAALEADATTRATMYGALRYNLQVVTRDYPNAKIILVRPPQAASRDYDDLLAAGEAIEQMAKRYSCQVIDALHDLGVVDFFETDGGTGRWLNDGVHFSTAGKTMYTNFLAKKILQLYS